MVATRLSCCQRGQAGVRRVGSTTVHAPTSLAALVPPVGLTAVDAGMWPVARLFDVAKTTTGGTGAGVAVLA